MSEQVTTIRAVVRALDGDQALVEVAERGCGRCHEEGGCGGQHLTQMFCGGPRTYHVDNAVSAQVGDRVDVAVPAGSLRRVANLAYGLPLLVMFLCAALGQALFGEPGGISGAALGLAAAFLWLRARNRRDTGKIDHQPYIVSRH